MSGSEMLAIFKTPLEGSVSFRSGRNWLFPSQFSRNVVIRASRIHLRNQIRTQKFPKWPVFFVFVRSKNQAKDAEKRAVFGWKIFVWCFLAQGTGNFFRRYFKLELAFPVARKTRPFIMWLHPHKVDLGTLAISLRV
jgi:hypothetical protein